MKTNEINNLVKRNTILWLAAMVLPALFSFAFASNKFPWQIVVPLLLIGPMLASNRMLIQAMEKNAQEPQEKSIHPEPPVKSQTGLD